MYISVLMTVGGIVLLTIGAELLVSGSVSLARRVGLSPLVIGLTVVSLGTSMPELVVSFDSVLLGSETIGLGNIVGSNISNIALVLGLAALVRPLQVEAQVLRLDGPILVGVSVLLVVLILDGGLGALEGGLLAVGVVAYLFHSVKAAQSSATAVHKEVSDVLPSRQGRIREIGFLVVGLGGLILGADILVEGGIHIAKELGVSKLVVGLTVVAVGTSLPELATTVLAAYRGNGDIAIGNAVGSSILNILGILGFTAAVFPLSTAGLSGVELVTMVGVAVLILPLLWTDSTLDRTDGAVLLLVYIVYLYLLFFWV